MSKWFGPLPGIQDNFNAAASPGFRVRGRGGTQTISWRTLRIRFLNARFRDITMDKTVEQVGVGTIESNVTDLSDDLYSTTSIGRS